MPLTKDIFKFFNKAPKKRDLSGQSKTWEDPKKMREESSTGSLTDMADDVPKPIVAIRYNFNGVKHFL